jgi:hypothetical protein
MRHRRFLRLDVLEVSELAMRANDAEQLGERTVGVADRTENERYNGRVEGRRLEGKSLGDGVNHSDRYRRPGRRFAGECSKMAFRLRGDDLGHARRVVAKIEPVSGSHFDNTARQALEKLAPVLSDALLFRASRNERIDPTGEDRIVNVRDPFAHGLSPPEGRIPIAHAIGSRLLAFVAFNH